MSICLTAEELKTITGRARVSAQLRWLREQGFTVRLRADGKPLVLRQHFEQLMGIGTQASKSQRPEPDWNALK